MKSNTIEKALNELDVPWDEQIDGDAIIKTVTLNQAQLNHLVNEVIKGCMDIVNTHEEGEDMGYCDTGADMECGCRSECVEMAMNRLNKVINTLP